MSTCLACGKVLDGHIQADAETGRAVQPESGDISICLYCSTISVYTENGDLREPTREEFQEAIKDQYVQRALLVARKVRKDGVIQ